MKTVCKENMCAGCMACVEVCKEKAITVVDTLYAYNAVIKEDVCINCGACERVCPNVSPVEKRKPIVWYQGWAGREIRENSSSGGAASAIIKWFIENGGYVAACIFDRGEFVFRITNNPNEAKMFAGSKYVKSNPKNIYEAVEKKLKNGERVLFVGLPCQVAAMKKYTKKTQNLYTIDLICHGTPSPKLLDTFLQEEHVDMRKLHTISFRKNTSFGLRSGADKLVRSGAYDMYTHAFLIGLDYTENCYWCPYAEWNRVSDVTLGDSWGSKLEKEEQEKGISLILCQTEKGEELISQSGIMTKEVDIERAVRSNQQLNKPMEEHKRRKTFFKYINKGFHTAIRKCEPKLYYKKKLKAILITLRLMKDNGN